MDQPAESQTISRKDVLYRLALLLDVGWPRFKTLQLWQIRNRAFVSGEHVVERKIEALDIQVTAGQVKGSEQPGQAQQEFNDWYRKAIEVEPELSSSEAEQQHQNHNQAFFDQLKREARSEK